MPVGCRETFGTPSGLDVSVSALALAGVVLGGNGAARGRPAGAGPTDRHDCQGSGAPSSKDVLEWNITGGRERAPCVGPDR